MNKPFLLPAHNWLTEPELAFDPLDDSQCHVHPLKGLYENGPFSKSIISRVYDPIRISFVVANGQQGLANQLMRELESAAIPRERKSYLINYPGFSSLFKTTIRAAGRGCHIELGKELDSQILSSESPHLVLSEALTNELRTLDARRNDFDVVFLILPERWDGAFRSKVEDFDLHDYIKAVMASRGTPVQMMLENRAFRYHCRCSVMWRLAIALYCKAGGVPWKLQDTDPNTAFVGLSYSRRQIDSDHSQFITCCSQVFDADGTGLEFVAFDIDDLDYVVRGNPFLTRAEMRRVMARSLALYQRRHAGQTPRRMVVHKSTHFTHQEVDGCFDACPNVEVLELVQIQQDTAWKGVQINRPTNKTTKGQPARYPCKRGSFLQIDGRSVLLWTQGNVPLKGGQDYFKEGKGVPSPLLIQRFAGHGSLDQICKDVVGLTKMNWNNDGLYDRLPVTMSYASILARTIKRMPKLDSRPYQFRFFM